MATQPPDTNDEQDSGPLQRALAFLEQRLTLPESLRRAADAQQDTTPADQEIQQLLDTLPDDWYKDQIDAYHQRQQLQEQRKRGVPPSGPFADSWIPLGPAVVDDRGKFLVSGRATDIAIAPGHGSNGQDRIYVASANGG